MPRSGSGHSGPLEEPAGAVATLLPMADLNGEPGVCDICGRSMLAGERTRTFLTRDREAREVCDLCVVRAERGGWGRAELAGAPPPDQGRDSGGRLRQLLDRARESAATRAAQRAEARAERAARAEAEARAEREAAPEPIESAERAPEPVSQPRIERPPTTRQREAPEPPPRRRSVPQNPEHRIRHAFERFNESSHRRTVSGLIRSLGGPWVSAVTRNETPAEVRITVAWELSWYQWEVDLISEARPVRELARGDEVSELDEADRDWNAHASEDGELRLGLVGSAAAG
jgi:hypothetical protein